MVRLPPPRVRPQCGTLIDGNGGRPVRNSVIPLHGERITAIGTVGSLAVPKGATVISTEGMTVLPGLWDMHVHLMLVGHGDDGYWDKTYPREIAKSIMPAATRQSLMHGITSVRDLVSNLEDIVDDYVGAPLRRGSHGDHPGGHLLAVGGHGSRQAGRHHRTG
ncbi:MAG: amidohydrolase family protein [Gemmatimonadaceae bacterium]|jgi:imidazolonepropionase-like amidohydrolase